MTTLTREERHRARRRAESQLAATQQSRFQGLYQQALQETENSSTARTRAVAQLARELPDAFQRFYRSNITSLAEAKIAQAAPARPVAPAATKTFFMDDPRRACNNVDTDTFFPARTEEAGTQRRTDAVKTCQRCPFTSECFRWADEHNQRHGIWGGIDMAKTSEVKAARAQLARA